MIKICAGEDCLQSYSLSYLTDRYVRLDKISATGDDNSTQYRPTTFTWDKYSLNHTEQAGHISESKIYNCKVYSGDFNGDGKSDIVIIPKSGADWNEWRLFLSDGVDGAFTFTSSGPIQAGLNDLIIGDFNGDGMDDMIQVRKISEPFTNYFMYYSTGSGFEQHVTSAFRSISVAHGVIPGDFNGDGMTDILNCHTNGYNMVCMRAPYDPVEQTGTWPTSQAQLYTGDFNGDGKTDILATGNQDSEWANFQMHLSTGTRFIQNDLPHYFKAVDKHVFVGDFNGDGKDDFYSVHRTSAYNALAYYLNDGAGISFTGMGGPKMGPLDVWQHTLGDFNGDGKTDFITTTTWSTGVMSKGYVSYTFYPEQDHILKTITDGMDCKTEIEYQYVTDPELHEKVSYVYPIRAIAQPFKLVSEVRQSNGIGGLNTIGYKYAGGKYHVQGRGFLGFDTVEETNYTNNTVTTSYYEVERNKYLTTLSGREIRTINGAPISKEEYINELQYNYGSRLHPVVSVAKSYDAPSGELIKTVITRDSYDAYGNNIFHSEKYSDNDSITYRTEYVNSTYDVMYNGNKWLLGLPTESSVVYHRDEYEIEHTTTCEYADESPLLKSRSVSYGNDLTVTESYKYDVCGNMIEKTETAAGESRTSKVEYDANYCLKTKYTDPQGYYSEYAHDPRTGAIIWEKGADGLESYFDNDSFGHQTHRRQKHASEVYVTRWSDNMPMAPTHATYFTYSKKTGEAPLLEFYDQLGRKLRTVGMQTNNHTVYTDMVYNASGLLASQSEPYFPGDTPRWHEFLYDEQQRLVTEEFPDGTAESVEYSVLADSQLKIVKFDRLSNKTAKILNCHDEIVESSVDDYSRVQFEYDPMGHCICAKGDNCDMYMSYDDAGRRIELESHDIGKYSFVYNGFGDLVRQVHDGTDSTVEFKVDAIGRVTHRYDSDGETRYFYDQQRLGLLSSAENGGSIKAYDYDEANRVYHEVKLIDWDEYYLWYSYNALNQLETIEYPNQKKVIQNYDQNGFLIGVDFDGKQVWSLTDVNANGAVTKSVLGNGLVIERSFDPITGLLTKIDNGGLIKHSYAFDQLGNLLKRTDEKRNLTEQFYYDQRYCLTGTEMDNGGIDSLQYDVAGNILSSPLGNFSYTDNQLTGISSESELIDPITAIDYTSYHKASGIRKLGTFPNILENSKMIYITYGPDQQRDMMTVSHDMGASLNRYGFTKKYINKYYETLSSNKEAGTADNQTCYIYAGNELVAVAGRTITDFGPVESLSYVHTDHLGSIVGYSDKDGDLTSEYSYDAWGRFRDCDTWEIKTEPYFNGRGFCGHEHIGSFGLINMNGRIYDPMTCRFISPDPYVQSPENPLSLNRYAYCLNNPLKYRDDTGELFFIDDFIFGFCRGLLTGKNPFKTGWQTTKNSFHIWKGLFSLDSNKSFFGRMGEFFSRFTYQLPQTALGLFTAHGYNMFGSVEKVKSLYGATVLTTHNMKGTSAMTLGSFIIGNSGTYADPNNATFQHEYGHYLQSQAMGWAYLSKVGIPSLCSAAGSGEHKYKPFELDANYRSFVYLNKYVPGFYKSIGDKGYGWDFKSHPLGVKGSPESIYLDYNDSDAMEQVRQSLSISAGWYHYIFPVVSTIFDH